MKEMSTIEEYFQNLVRNSNSEKLPFFMTVQADTLVTTTNNHIFSQIIDGLETIADQPVRLKLENTKKQQSLNIEQIAMKNQLMSIQQHKNKMKKKLHDLLQKQDNINIDLNLSQVRSKKMKDSRSVKNKMNYRSELTESDKEKLKGLVRQMKKHQRQLKSKTTNFNTEIQRQQLESQDRKRQLRQQMKKKRKHNAEINLQQRENEKQKIKQQMKSWGVKMKQILKQKRLYENMQEQWKIKENEEEEQKIEQFKQLKNHKHINFQQIRQHQLKYNETILAQRQLKSSLLRTSKTNVNHQNQYSEENQRKQEEEIKKQVQIQLINKRHSYGEEIRKNYLPKIAKPPHTIDEQTENKENTYRINLKCSRSLDLFEMHRKGVEYMRTANALNCQKAKGHPQTQAQKQPQSKYRNYLAESRAQKGNISLKKRSKIDEISQIMRQKRWAQDEKIEKAKVVAQKIEKNDYLPKQKVLINSISAKLEILKQLS